MLTVISKLAQQSVPYEFDPAYNKKVDQNLRYFFEGPPKTKKKTPPTPTTTPPVTQETDRTKSGIHIRKHQVLDFLEATARIAPKMSLKTFIDSHPTPQQFHSNALLAQIYDQTATWKLGSSYLRNDQRVVLEEIVNNNGQDDYIGTTKIPLDMKLLDVSEYISERLQAAKQIIERKEY